MSEAKTTTSLRVIREWVEKRDGRPSKVKGTGKKGVGLLRIVFPGEPVADTLETIPWDEWYDIFLQNKLKFVYREKTSDGKTSRLFKLIH